LAQLESSDLISGKELADSRQEFFGDRYDGLPRLLGQCRLVVCNFLILGQTFIKIDQLLNPISVPSIRKFRLAHRRFLRRYASSPNELVVLGVWADPEPDNTFRLLDAQGTVVYPDANRPQLFRLADFLEVRRGVMEISLEQLKVLARQLPDLL